jgi:RND superfamily putative drug exporter
MKESGVGMATAVLVDATLVRVVLLPAAMKLLGERNWYVPRWLSWLPAGFTESAPGSATDDAAATDQPDGTDREIVRSGA